MPPTEKALLQHTACENYERRWRQSLLTSQLNEGYLITPTRCLRGQPDSLSAINNNNNNYLIHQEAESEEVLTLKCLC